MSKDLESYLTEIGEQARKQRLEGNRKNDSEFPLTGYCFDNAFVVYKLLSEEGYDEVQLVAGLAEEYAEDLLREVDIEELDTVQDLAGQVHYWVEVDNYVIDIAPMIEEFRGEVYVAEELPDSYHRLDDSYEEGEKTLQSARDNLCWYCGGRRRFCGCPKETE